MSMNNWEDYLQYDSPGSSILHIKYKDDEEGLIIYGKTETLCKFFDTISSDYGMWKLQAKGFEPF